MSPIGVRDCQVCQDNGECNDHEISQTFDLENNYGLLKNQRKFFFYLNFKILNLKLL